MVHLMMENQEDLAGIMTIEQGKPLAESRGEVVYGATRTSDLAVSADAHFAPQIKRLIGCTSGSDLRHFQNENFRAPACAAQPLESAETVCVSASHRAGGEA